MADAGGMSFDGSDMDSIRRLIARMEIASYSTAFSGVDCPGTSFAMLRAEAAHMTGQSINAPRHLHAVDTGRAAKEMFLYHAFMFSMAVLAGNT